MNHAITAFHIGAAWSLGCPFLQSCGFFKAANDPLDVLCQLAEVKLSDLKGGAFRKGMYLFQIAPLNPALKGGAYREGNRSKLTIYRQAVEFVG
ncbi:MAG: hypothetical protein ACYS0I_14370 [Planctomycetota bacterium]|jgi:hypothetical protein